MTGPFDGTCPLYPGTCEWCGRDCEGNQTACSPGHEALVVQREAAQAKLVIRSLKRWRRYRGRKGTPGEGAISHVARLVDKMLQADRRNREKNSPKLLEPSKAKPTFTPDPEFPGVPLP